MIISVLLPSRMNPYHCSVAIDSYIHNFSNKNELEILLGLDEDDNTKEFLIDKYRNDHRIVPTIFKRVGYWNNHILLNIMAKKSRGHILWMGNCKSMVLSKNWDLHLNKYEGKFIVASHITEWYDCENVSPPHRYSRRQCMLFPIVSRQYLDLLGKFSNYCRNDSWIGSTIGYLHDFGADGGDLLRKIHPVIDQIVINHDRSKTPKYTEPTFEKEWCIKDSDVPEEYKKYGHIFTNECTYGRGQEAYDMATHERKFDGHKIYKFLKENPFYLP